LTTSTTKQDFLGQGDDDDYDYDGDDDDYEWLYEEDEEQGEESVKISTYLITQNTLQ